MAAQAGRGNADKDRVWVCATDPDCRWICDYGADCLPKEFAFGGGTRDSLEAGAEGGALGTCQRRADVGLRGLRRHWFDSLQDGAPIHNASGGPATRSRPAPPALF